MSDWNELTATEKTEVREAFLNAAADATELFDGNCDDEMDEAWEIAKKVFIETRDAGAAYKAAYDALEDMAP